MPMPVRELPVVQNWSCQGCSDCCRTYSVRVTDEEKQRIDQQNWNSDPTMAGITAVKYDTKSSGWRLNHTSDGTCVFLDENNRCRIHAKFGEPAKPMACRIYPFVLVPAGDHWRVGMRFSCPTVVKNKGKTMAGHAGDLREYAGLMEADSATPPRDFPAPELQPNQRVPWPDLLKFVKAIDDILRTPDRPIERKLRTIHALSVLCKSARFESVTGRKLDEFLDVVSIALGEEIPADPYAVPKPGWVGRMIFRQVAALYCRKDLGLNKGAIAGKGRIALARAAYRFARGKGRIPQLHGLMPKQADFAQAEVPARALPPESEELLLRYFRVKVESMQFAGPTNFRLDFWDGLESLLMTFPITLWLARVIAQEKPLAEAVAIALRIVDDNFGFNPLYGPARQRFSMRMLNNKGEIPKLIAWYAR